MLLSLYNYLNGTSPHIRWMDVEAQSKVNMYYGYADTPDATPTPRTPVQIRRNGVARNYFAYNAGANFRRDLPIGWFLEQGGGGLMPTFVEVGSVFGPLTPTNADNAAGCTGTIASWTTTHIIGVGTNFKSKLYMGAFLYQDSTTEYRQVIQVVSDTECYVASAFSGNVGTAWGVTFLRGISDIADGPFTKWMQVSTDVAASVYAVSGTIRYLKVILTLVYNDYQESDPIYRASYQGVVIGGTTYEPDATLGAFLSFAKMNKNISGIRCYATATDSILHPSYNDWVVADTDYFLIQEYPFDSLSSSGINWAVENWFETLYRIPIGHITKDVVDGAKASGAQTLGGNLAHAATYSRSYLTPRFAVQTARGGVGIVAVDQDDSTLRLSSYDGDGAHEDDNFPNDVLDSNNQRQIYTLQSRGEMLGMGIFYDKIAVVKRTETEIIDLQSNLQSIVSRRGILATPIGLFIPGRAGITLLPWDGGAPTIINIGWRNRYDGTERTSDATLPRVTDSSRSAIVAGYNPVFREAWFYLVTLDADGTSRNLSYRYSMESRKWNCREVGCGTTSPNTLAAFVTGKDNTFSILFGQTTADGSANRTNNGILEYPNMNSGTNYDSDTVSRYEDSVLYDGSSHNNDTSSNKGIFTRLLLAFGDLYGIFGQVILDKFFIDHQSFTKSGYVAGQFEIKLFANNDYELGQTMDTKTHPFGTDYPRPRGVPRRGQISSLMMQIQINDAAHLYQYKNFIIRGLELMFGSGERMGNT